MARSIDDYQEYTAADVAPDGQDRRATRSTARAFAAAISALAISALVITTSSDALDQTGTVAENNLQAGTITLIDDDENRALFDLHNMAPNAPRTECIRLVYEGTIVPVELTMAATAPGPLAQYLDLTIEQGTGAGFRDCEGFEPESTLIEGTLTELVALGSQPLQEFLNEGDELSFRFRFEMEDVQAAVGQTTTVDFSWEVTPS